MKPLIIASKKDPAGVNIIENLKKLNCKIPIHLVDTDIVHAENIDKTLKNELKLDFDFIIFASKHQSVKKVRSLSVHPIGNWKKADFGGKDSTICPSNALVLKHFFQTLEKAMKNEDLDYQLTMESTHHGPYIETPCLFIEIGSTSEEWNDKKTGELIAKIIIDSINTIKNKDNKNLKIAFGIGGPHYCPNFNPIQLNNNFAISHVIAEYALPLTEKQVSEAINKTLPKPHYVLVDWKGLGNATQRNNALDILKKFNLEIVKTSEGK
ncbi:hypothetical protein J4466_05365 [Candidatus Pacearchaeota archaeon]|nr:hypothetical protein [Candidatus Pacearchaeota archaeon]